MGKTAQEKLIELVKANPTLPIVAAVDSDVVCDDGFAWWLGEITNAEINEVISIPHNEFGVVWKDDLERLEDLVYDDDYLRGHCLRIPDNLSQEDTINLFNERFPRYVEMLPWEKVIAVTVSTPECYEVKLRDYHIGS
jgi:hypothetical protein